MDITTIGFDLAKTVFQVHGADAKGRPVLRRKLRRGKVLAFFAELPSCVVGMEACASAHYWARELQALGHKVRLINMFVPSSRRTRTTPRMRKRSVRR